jgi:8-oxo-dGTP pyrophosphatase MutT (NUDIX family)
VSGEPPALPTPVAPRPAATVVLARDVPAGGIEIYLVQRHASIGFMGGMHVFPGGKVCDGDALHAMRACVGDAAELCCDAWGDDVDAGASFARTVAAARETFEEAGVLLGASAPRATLDALRRRLLAGEAFATLLAEQSLTLQLASLQPFSRWITPESEPVRFDTSFFLARAPDGQEAEHDRMEAIDALWIAPTGALEASARGQIRLAPPTALTLESLRDAVSVEAAHALARSRPPPVVLPMIRPIGNELVLLYPGDPDHPVKARVLDGPTRRVLRKL